MARTTRTRPRQAKHVEEIHRSEELVESLEESQARLRERARRIIGVTGNREGMGRLRDG